MGDTVCILRDQDEWTPPAPSGLTFQLSLLTWIERDGGSADPWALARLAVPRLAGLVQADRVVAEYWHRTPLGVLRPSRERLHRRRDLADLMKQSDSELEQTEEFPHRLVFSRATKPVLCAVAEFWNRVGGPAPYHDSVAIAFFSDADRRLEIERVILDAFNSAGT